MPRELDPRELEIKLRAYYNEWNKEFNYYVDIKAQQLTMPNGVVVKHESSWRIEKWGYPSLSGTPVFHVWSHENIPYQDFRTTLDTLSEIAEHVVADDERKRAARQELILRETEKLQTEIAKLEKRMNELPFVR